MGWKRIKEHFRIEHIVQVRDGQVLIGSPYVHELITVRMDGSVEWGKLGRTSNGEIRRYWDELSADPALVARLLAEPDKFAQSIPVFTYDGAQIIEKLCEEPGYPNATHDGVLMYENTFSTSRAEIVEWAHANAKAAVEWMTRSVADRKEELLKAEARLAEAQAVLADTGALLIQHRNGDST